MVFFCENTNKTFGEASTLVSDFQHQEKIEVHVSSNEFKEVEIVEAIIFGTTTIYCMNKVNVLKHDHRKSFIRLITESFSSNS